MAEKLEVLQGTLDLLILRTLQWGTQHGHGIGQAIRAKSDDLLQVDHGSLYPALHRLQREGWIAAEWGVTENRQRAKFYRLTPAGRKQLVHQEARWKLFVRTVARVLRPQE
jgi:transcriptional regulator